MNETTAVLRMDSWVGRETVRCTVVGETPKRYRIRLEQDARLPGNRQYKKGDEVLVPKYAVKIQ